MIYCFVFFHVFFFNLKVLCKLFLIHSSVIYFYLNYNLFVLLKICYVILNEFFFFIGFHEKLFVNIFLKVNYNNWRISTIVSCMFYRSEAVLLHCYVFISHHPFYLILLQYKSYFQISIHRQCILFVLFFHLVVLHVYLVW